MGCLRHVACRTKRDAAEALCRPEVAEELYDLLGGGPDPIGGARTLNKR